MQINKEFVYEAIATFIYFGIVISGFYPLLKRLWPGPEEELDKDPSERTFTI